MDQDDMDQEDIAEVVQAFYHRLIGAGETTEAGDLISPEIHVTSRGGRFELLGEELSASESAHTYSLDELLKAVGHFHETFSHVRIEIESAEPEGPDVRVKSSLELTPGVSADRPNPPLIVFHNQDLVRIDDERRVVSISRDLPDVEASLTKRWRRKRRRLHPATSHFLCRGRRGD